MGKLELTIRDALATDLTNVEFGFSRLGIYTTTKIADRVLLWMRENGYEKREEGSCWDQGPTLRVTDGECPPTPPLCELQAGHLGAHREGCTEWMRRESVVMDDAMADSLIDIVWSSPNRISARSALLRALTPDGQEKN